MTTVTGKTTTKRHKIVKASPKERKKKRIKRCKTARDAKRWQNIVVQKCQKRNKTCMSTRIVTNKKKCKEKPLQKMGRHKTTVSR